MKTAYNLAHNKDLTSIIIIITICLTIIVSMLLELKTFVNERRTNIRLEVGKKFQSLVSNDQQQPWDLSHY